MGILLYSPHTSERLHYVAEYLFNELLGTPIELTNDSARYEQAEAIAINYSSEPIRDEEVRLCPRSLLFETGVREQSLNMGVLDDIPICFEVLPGYALPFDPLAAGFFVLSRYEEYLPFDPDAHGRYPAALSWAARSGALDRPILWEWAKLLLAAIQRQYPQWTPPANDRDYRFLPTYDIDIPWAYRHRSWRGLARTGIDLLTFKWDHCQARIQAWLASDTDPFFTFPQLQDLHERYALRPTVFWLVGDSARYDINPNPNLAPFRTLIQDVQEWSDIGLHPSYAKGQQAKGITMEKERLEAITGDAVQRSRQHFLRLSLPTTYQQLLAAGITEDYSMGFADRPGFRAGTSEPFFWYDLEQETVTNLRIYPFAVMDVSLQKYLKLSPDQAQAFLLTLQVYCQDEGLSLCTLWHNSSFSSLHAWDDWWAVYTALFENNKRR